MHNVSEFKYNYCKQLDNKSPIQTHLPTRALYIKRHKEKREDKYEGPRTRERESTRHKEGEIREKEREEGEAQRKKEKQKTSGEPDKRWSPILTFFSFLQLPLSFCITPPEARKRCPLPSLAWPREVVTKSKGEATSPPFSLVTTNIWPCSSHNKPCKGKETNNQRGFEEQELTLMTQQVLVQIKKKETTPQFIEEQFPQVQLPTRQG